MAYAVNRAGGLVVSVGGVVVSVDGAVVVLWAGGVVVVSVDVVVVSVGVVVVVSVGVVVVVSVGVVDVLELIVPGPLVLDEPDDELLLDELELLDELDELVDVLVIDGTVVAIDGVPPVTLPGGGSGTIDCPWRAPCMNAVQMVTGTVPPVISAYPPTLVIWFSALREASPRYIPTAAASCPGVKPLNHAE